MSTTTSGSRRTGAAGAWTSGLAVFAAFMLITVGTFQFLEGLAALINGDFFVVGDEYAFHVDVTVWGWVHLLLGIGLAALGVFVLQGKSFARFTAMGLAALSAVANFLFIPYQPVWSVLVIALNVAVIWALAAYDPDRP